MKNILTTTITGLTLIILLLIFSIMPDKTMDNSDEYQQYAAIFPINTDYTTIVGHIIQAGGLPLREGFHHSIMITASKDKNYLQKLYQQGALFVFKPLVKGACITENKTSFGRNQI